MMAAGTLFTYPDNFKAFKGLIAAEYSGAKVKVGASIMVGESSVNLGYGQYNGNSI